MSSAPNMRAACRLNGSSHVDHSLDKVGATSAGLSAPVFNTASVACFLKSTIQGLYLSQACASGAHKNILCGVQLTPRHVYPPSKNIAFVCSLSPLASRGV